ncbi:MAG TPA: hypothetical protein VGH74_03830 [Planctomycetaceae bacterium]
MSLRKIGGLLCGVCLAWGLTAAEPAHAGDWMFRRSYYSHSPIPGLLDDSPPSRSSYAEPWTGAHSRFAIRGGWRINTFTIQNGTGSVDRTFFRDAWYDVNY